MCLLDRNVLTITLLQLQNSEKGREDLVLQLNKQHLTSNTN